MFPNDASDFAINGSFGVRDQDTKTSAVWESFNINTNPQFDETMMAMDHIMDMIQMVTSKSLQILYDNAV